MRGTRNSVLGMDFVDSRNPGWEVIMEWSVATGWGEICKKNNEYNKFDGAKKDISTWSTFCIICSYTDELTTI